MGDFPYSGVPSMWVAKDGLPAAIVGNPAESGWQIGSPRGLPSAETDDGFVVFEALFVLFGSLSATPRMFPLRYDTFATLAAGGPTPMHHEPGALWEYRPCVYSLHLEVDEPWRRPLAWAEWARQGSQHELQWRKGLAETIAICHDHDSDPIVQANEMVIRSWREARAVEKANDLLRSMLAPTQLTECVLGDCFRVIGGATGRVYKIELGNGFAQVDPLTNEKIISYCYHPEDWMPDADIALSIKLHLECGDLEEDFISGANARRKRPRRPADEETRLRFDRAWSMERELIPA